MKKNKPFQGAYAQTVRDKDKNGWVVYDKDGDRLGVLPQPCDEHTAMAAIRLCRKAENEGFTGGVEFGKQAMMAAQQQRLLEMSVLIENLRVENQRLAEMLEKRIG